MDNTIKELWGASVYIPNGTAEKVNFSYSQIEIVRQYFDAIELRNFCFVSRNYSTKHFNPNMFRTPYTITDELTVFYSDSKQECIDWLKKRKVELIAELRRKLEQIENVEIRKTTDMAN